MKEPKLTRLIATLNGHERKMAVKFLDSVYFNENPTLVLLFNILSSERAEELNKETIWKKLFPGEKFSDIKFRRLCSDLLKLLEEFLAVRRFRKDEVQVQLHWLEELNERKLIPHFTQAHASLRTRQQQKDHLDKTFFYHQFLIEEKLYQHLENLNQRTAQKNLAEAVSHLDAYYLIQKLKYSCAMLHYGQMMNTYEAIPLLPELEKYLAGQKEIRNPVIKSYYLILKTFQEPENEHHFTELKKVIEKPEASDGKPVAFETQREIFLYAINFCVKKINSGDLKYLREIFTLYKYGLRRNFLFHAGELSPWDYKNIVVTALRLGEHRWVEKFIDQYKQFLPDQDRSNAVVYNQAKLFFYKQDFEKVLKLLQRVEYNDVFYILDSKSMLLKSYYELGEYESLQSLCNSFSILLRRKKIISESHRENHLNFIRALRQLIRLTAEDQPQIKTLEQEIENTRNIADKGWLLEKAKQLLSGASV